MKLTLAQIDAEIPDAEPFVVELDAKTSITLPNPRDMETSLLLDSRLDMFNPTESLKLLLGEDGYAMLVSYPGMTVGRMEVIFTHWTDHFGILPPGEGVASPNSLNRAARRSKQTLGSRRTAKAS